MAECRRDGARANAWFVLQRVVLEDQQLSDAFRDINPQLSEQDRGFCKSLCFGVLRWQPRLAAITARLLKKPLRQRDRDIDILIWLGLQQLLDPAITDYAAVNETVALVGRRSRQWAGKLVNGVLRNFQRQQQTLLTAVQQDTAARLAHPAWLLERLRADWPDHWQAIAEANNQHPPLTLRIRDDATQACSRLTQAGLEFHRSAHTPGCVTLATPVPVEQIPGFTAGLFTVQDEAAQQAARLLDAQAGDRVLDACAAPGGKTAQLYDHQPGGLQLLALDQSATRIERMQRDLTRLDITVPETRTADATRPQDWWDGEPFQRILLDAPCSATGIIRRQPDIKLRRTPAQLQALAATQRALLDALWPLLETGGRLLYATCSVLKAENQQQIAAFLRRHAEARLCAQTIPGAQDTGSGYQILPGERGMDGFFYAALEKQA